MIFDANAAPCRPEALRQRAVEWRTVFAAVLLLAVAPAVAFAQAPVLGSSGSGMRGLVHTGLPLTAPELNLSLSAGYGLTDAFEPVPGVHHRGQASFGAALSPLPWLSFALRLDGRLEMHPDDGDGPHSAGFGDPRVFARAGHVLSRELAIGAELGGWFPGTEAPSIEPGASSAEGRVLLAFTPESSPWVVLGAAGFRLDNSAESAPAVSRLRLGDRISLGASDSNAVLAAAGVARRFGRAVEAFGELSADFLVGGSAPSLLESPLRAAIGGRYFFSPSLQMDLTAIGSLSKRPDMGANDTLVPIEPRVLVLLGVRYSISFASSAAKPLAPAAVTKPVPATTAVATPPKPENVSLTGALVDDKGEPLPEASVTLRVAGGEMRDAITDAKGRYTFHLVPVGPATIEVVATGFQTQTWEIDVQPGIPELPPRTLETKADSGFLRGLIRTFQSEPLRAQITVRDRRGRTVSQRDSAEDGHFELDLPPGNYEVTITARGYRTHRRPVRIDGNGVSILNVDMREGK